MKKLTLKIFLLVFLLGTYMGVSQVLNQAASWPNAGWTLSGTYNGAALLGDPSNADANFNFDDDAAGGGSSDNLILTSPVIDLTAANGAGENLISVSGDFVYRALGGDVLQIEVYDADLATWSALETFTGNSFDTSYQSCSGTVSYTSAQLDVSGFTPTQLAGFQYRFTYDDQSGWQWGWCLTSPTITSAAPITCPVVTGLTIDSFTASTVNVSWTNGGSETDWEIAIQADGTGTPVGAGTSISANPHFEFGLTANTAYEVYVRADCGPGDLSTWAGPVDFTTDPIVVPDCPASFTATPDAACGNFDTALSWDASPGATNYFITVGTSTGANDILDNVSLGNVTSTTVTGQTAGQTYFYTVSPENIVGTNTTCTEQTYTTFATGCLCTSVPSSLDNNGISNVRINNNPDFVSGVVTYVDHSGTAVDLPQGLLVSCDITFETGFTYDTNIWIDFNDDLTFDVSELVFSGEAPATNPNVFAADFTIPGAANLGTHKMRIGTADSGQATPDPCYSGTFGVTLDFDVNITAVACTPATIASTTVVDNCAAGTFTVEVDVTDPGTATFIVGSFPQPIVAGNNILGPFPNDISQDLTVVDVTDGSCNFIIGSFINSQCPPPAPTGVTCVTGSSSIVFSEEFDDLSAWTGDIDVAGDGDWETNDNGGGSGGTGPFTENSGPANSYIAYEASGIDTSTASAVSPAINLTNAVDGAELAFFMHAYGADMGTLNVGVGTSAAGPFTTEYTWSGEFQTLATDAWVPVGVDLSAYMGQVIYIEFSHTGSGTGFEGDMAIDTMTVEACGNFCFEPSGLTVSNITSSGADFAWTANSGETDWEVVVQAAGGSAPTGAGTATTSNPYTFSGLSAETAYEAYVRSDCGSGAFSIYSGPIAFTTACAAVTPDYTADMSQNVPDSCWEQAGSGEVAAGPGDLGASDWANNRNYGGTASNSINLWQNVDREWLLSPTFDLSGGTYQLEVEVAVTDFASATDPDTMGSDDEVQLLISTDGGATWVNLTTWNAGNQPDVAGTEYIEDLSAYTGNAQFAIWASDGPVDDLNDYDFHVGKFVVRTPPTCGDVAGITVDSFDDTSAQISWTDAEGETNWEIAVQTAGTGVPGAANDTGQDTATNPYSATGLAEGTPYEVYVRADCSGDGTNLGSWIGPVNFTTLPGGPDGVTCVTGGSSIIFTEEFDAQGLWTGNINGGNDTWEIPDGSTSANTGPAAAFSGANFMNWEASGNNTNTGVAVSPEIDLGPAVDGAELAFYMFAYGADMGTLNVGVSTTGPGGPFTTEFTWVGQLQTAATDAWVPVGVDLSAYMGNQIYIQFSQTGSGGGNFSGDMSIDLMTVEACGAYCVDPSAIAVSNVNGSEAEIAWTSNGTETTWEVAVQTAGTGIPGGAGTSTTSNPYTETGLSELTAYEVYVRADCAGSFSAWAGPINFSTTEACPTVTGLTIDSFTDTTAEISWTNGGGVNEAGWEIVVQADGLGIPGGAGTAATSPYSASGLTAETAYEVYVRANCGVTDGDSAWAGPVDFTTSCTPILPDYSANMAVNVPDTCWEEAGSGEIIDGPGGLGASDWRQGTSYGFGSSNAINLWQSVDREWLLSPAFDLSADGYELIVNVAVTDFASAALPDTMGSDDEVQLLMSTDGGVTWTNLTTWNVGNQPDVAGTEYTEDLTGITGSGVRFAIFASDGAVDDLEDYDFHIGRFEVRTIPSCPDVSAVNVTNLTENSATIGWTNGGAETAWEVAIQAPGGGTPASGAAAVANPYNATGLSSLTAYEVYVRADCGGAGFGNWAGPVSFTTPAPVVSTFPYNEDFDAGAGGWIADNTTNGTWELGAPANTIINSADTGTDAWVTDLDGQYNANENSFVLSPPFDMSGLVNPAIDISIWYNSEFSWDGMVLQSSIDGGATWQNVGSELDGINWYNDTTIAAGPGGQQVGWTGRNSSGNGSGGWLAANNFLTGLAGESSVFLRVAFAGDGSFQDEGCAFDSVSIYDVTCPDITGLTIDTFDSVSADISWTAGDSETDWEIVVQADGLGEPVAAGTATTSNPYTATGLSDGVAYEVWVRADCGGGDFSDWVGPVDFTTIPLCTPVTAVVVSNITTTSADIGWTNGATETDWEVAVQAAGTGTPGGAGAATTANPYAATALTPSTDYEVYVRADCGGDLSPWEGPVNFTTDTPPITSYPYSQDFESGSGGWTADNTANGTWELGAPANTVINSADSGTNAWVTDLDGDYNANEDSFVTSPTFDLSTLTDPLIDISIWYNAEFSWDGAVLQSSIDGGTSWQNVGSESDGANWYNDTTIGGNPGGQQVGWTGRVSTGNGSGGWLAASNSLTGLGGQSSVLLRVAFGGDGSVQDEGFAFDSVVVRENLPGTYTYTDGVWTPSTPSNDLDDIIIASGNLPIGSDFTCNTMTVNPGAAVTVDGGSTLTASGGLFFESSATSYSSLIRNGNVSGPIQYVRHVNQNGSGSTGSNDLISAPLTGQAFSDFAVANPNIFSNTAGTLFLFGPFDKATGSYVTWADTETATLDPGVGYRAASDDNGSFTFVGTDNNSNVAIDIQNSGPNNAEWNLVGNPYPSYVNIFSFLTTDVGGVINIQLFDAPTAALYGYDGSALNGWRIFNLATSGSSLMAPGQGFFVSADATNTGPYDLLFTPAVRTAGSSDDFIAGRNAELLYLTLSLTSNTNEYSTDFYFNPEASEGFDVGYDAAVWGETPPAFSIYSRIVQGDAGDAIALQTLKNTDFENVTIPLGVNANQGEQVTFRIHESTLPENVKVYLDDTVENTTTLLNDSDYIITPSAQLSGTGRFFLRYEQDNLSTNVNGLDQLDIFTMKDSDELVINGELVDNATMDLFDIQGRLVLTKELDSALLQNRIDVSNINAGIYLVTVKNNSQETTKKVIIE